MYLTEKKFWIPQTRCNAPVHISMKRCCHQSTFLGISSPQICVLRLRLQLYARQERCNDFSNLLGTEAYAIPAGDYIVHPDFWKDTVTGSTVVALSRSGKTSEMVRAIKHIRAELACPVISISMLRDNDLSALSELSLILDWCYDESVCQTRTVTNLYVSTLLLAAKYIKNPMLAEFVKQACRDNENFQHNHRSCFEEIAEAELGKCRCSGRW